MFYVVISIKLALPLIAAHFYISEDTPVTNAADGFSVKLPKWLSSHQMKAYLHKCHLITRTKTTEPINIDEKKNAM